MSVACFSVLSMAISEEVPVGEFPHRLLWFAERAEAVLDDVLAGGLHVATLPAEVTAEAVTAFSVLATRLQAVATSLLPHAEAVDVAAAATPVATSTGAWFAAATRTPVGAAHRSVKVAKRLDTHYEATRDAALRGRLRPDQVEVVVTALDGLPSWVSADQRRRAEEHLIGLAAQHDAKALKLLARHLLHVIDPEGADAELAKQLEREEVEAQRRTSFTMVDDGAGLCHGKFRIPSLQGAMLSTALAALTSPKRPDAIEREITGEDGAAVERSTPELLGQAFVELIDRYPTKKLPRAGGGLATVLVTIPLSVIEEGLGVATLSTGGHITVGAARRLACHHGIIPQVLGPKSELLDQGRKTRLHTEPQRIAMISRDKTCAAEGCSIPAAWCHAHHRYPWSEGGRTSVTDGRMVCPRHHSMIHKPGFVADYLPNGKIRLSKRRTVRRQ